MRRVWVVCAALLGACAHDNTPHSSVTIIDDVTVLDGRGGAALPSRSVHIDGGTIIKIAPAGTRKPRGAKVIDGTGGYLLPGFIDLHSHLLVPRCNREGAARFDRSLSERMLSQQLAFGVTFIRSPGNPTEDGLRLRDDLNAKRVRGPSALASAEIINDWKWSDEQLRNHVAEAMPHRPDYFKVYAALSPQQIKTVIDAAHARGVPVIGHLQETSWHEAALLGIDYITHGADWSEKTLRPEHRAEYLNAVKERGGIKARLTWLRLLDFSSPEFQSTAKLLAQRRIPVDPTIVAYDSKFLSPRAPTYRQNRYVDLLPELHSDWQQCTNITRNWTDGDYQEWGAVRHKLLKLVQELHAAGVVLATGTDVTNPWVIPGESLHQEFELLVEAGLAPADVLRMTGENAAFALRRPDIGIIEQGRRADLVLLARSPLEDIRNTRSIKFVMQAGQIVSEGPTMR